MVGAVAGASYCIGKALNNNIYASESAKVTTAPLSFNEDMQIIHTPDYGRNIPQIYFKDGQIVYNMIRNPGLENKENPVWGIYKYTDGIIDLFDSTDAHNGKYSCYLEPYASSELGGLGIDQSFKIKKSASDFNIDSGLSWYCKKNSSDFFEVYVAFSTGKNILAYAFGAQPPEDSYHKVINLGLGMPNNYTKYIRNLGRDWLSKGFSADDKISSMEVDAITNNNKTEAVSFDDFELLAPLYKDISVDSMTSSRACSTSNYIPKVIVSNKGMDTQRNIMISAKIFKDGNIVYNQYGGLEQDSLGSLESAEVKFKEATLTNGLYDILFINTHSDEIWEDDTLKESLTIAASINEQPTGLETRVFNVYPTILRGNALHVTGTSGFDVYNVTGAQVGKYEVNTTGIYGFNYPEGVYFIKPQEQGLPTKKVVKVK